MNMQIAVVQTSSSNLELTLAIKQAGMEPVELSWDQPQEVLSHFDGYVIEGLVGKAAVSPAFIEVMKQQCVLGKPILGIGYGAQILVEAGLIPGVENNKPALIFKNRVLSVDDSARIYICLSDNYQYNAFTRCLTPHIVLQASIEQVEGYFLIPPALLAEIQENGLNVFLYCDEQGNLQGKQIAAVSNKGGNVMAVVPHLAGTLGVDTIFKSMRDYIEKGYKQKVAPLYYYPRAD